MVQKIVINNDRITEDISIEDVSTHLHQNELKITDLKRDCEKEVIWFGQEEKKTPISVVYIHGFSASKHETRPYADSVAKELKANLFYTRLDGHGCSNQNALGKATLENWKKDFEEALTVGSIIGNEIVFIGSSTGAALVAYGLAQENRNQKIAALIFLSPNFGLQAKGSELLKYPFGSLLARLIIGKFRVTNPRNAAHKKWWSTTYPSSAIACLMRLVNQARKSNVEDWGYPTLFIYSPGDQVISLKEMDKMYRRIGSKIKSQIIVNEPNDIYNHVITGSALSPNTTDLLIGETSNWLRMHVSK